MLSVILNWILFAIMNAVGTMCSSCSVMSMGLISGLGIECYMPCGKKQNIKNRSSIVTNLIKTVKMVQILKNLKRKFKQSN